jgi:hypothetical protein
VLAITARVTRVRREQAEGDATTRRSIATVWSRRPFPNTRRIEREILGAADRAGSDVPERRAIAVMIDGTHDCLVGHIRMT